jgi:hypothetical protein
VLLFDVWFEMPLNVGESSTSIASSLPQLLVPDMEGPASAQRAEESKKRDSNHVKKRGKERVSTISLLPKG